jgi:hypothetical protein
MNNLSNYTAHDMTAYAVYKVRMQDDVDGEAQLVVYGDGHPEAGRMIVLQGDQVITPETPLDLDGIRTGHWIWEAISDDPFRPELGLGLYPSARSVAADEATSAWNAAVEAAFPSSATAAE